MIVLYENPPLADCIEEICKKRVNIVILALFYRQDSSHQISYVPTC